MGYVRTMQARELAGEFETRRRSLLGLPRLPATINEREAAIGAMMSMLDDELIPVHDTEGSVVDDMEIPPLPEELPEQ